MTKYEKYFQKMIEENQTLFDEFKALHAKYSLDPEAWQTEFNREGAKILKLINEHENKLCHHSEGGQYAKFAGNLADKFQKEVRKLLPLIDHVGIIESSAPKFQLKKINLS
jgi:hypothetical protein